MYIRLAGTVQESIVDGPGIRYVVFTQGCPHRCKGCHNPNTQDFSLGNLRSVEEIAQEFDVNPYVAGITLSGGEPFCQAQALVLLAQHAKQSGKSVVAYSGYTYEELVSWSKVDSGVLALLRLTDILIDGTFIVAQRDLRLQFRGSSNQRLIDVASSLRQGQVVEWKLS